MSYCPFEASVAQFSRPKLGLKSHCTQDDAQETQQDITIQPTWNAEAEEVHDLLSKAGLYWCVRDTCPHQHNDQIDTWYNTTYTARSTTQHHAAHILTPLITITQFITRAIHHMSNTFLMNISSDFAALVCKQA